MDPPELLAQSPCWLSLGLREPMIHVIVAAQDQMIPLLQAPQKPDFLLVRPQKTSLIYKKHIDLDDRSWKLWIISSELMWRAQFSKTQEYLQGEMQEDCLDFSSSPPRTQS